jgi:hypothetical protein
VLVHKLSPVTAEPPEAAPTDLDRFTVRCRCGFQVISPDAVEAMAVATEHVAPGMGEFAADLFSQP